MTLFKALRPRLYRIQRTTTVNEKALSHSTSISFNFSHPIYVDTYVHTPALALETAVVTLATVPSADELFFP